MKTNILKVGVVASGALFLFAQDSFCLTLIDNGGLELMPPDSVIQTVLPGQSYAGWKSVGLGDIEFCPQSVAGPAAEGQGLVDLNGVSFQGAISQTLGTSSGTAYKVRFALSGNPGLPGEGKLGNKTMDVLWNGSVVGSFVFSHLPTDTQHNLRWDYHELTLLGNGSDLLSFASTTSAYNDAGPMLDNITVVVVPEPSVVAFLSVSLAFLGRSFRRTGNVRLSKKRIKLSGFDSIKGGGYGIIPDEAD